MNVESNARVSDAPRFAANKKPAGSFSRSGGL
jgi:hypothetical protein